MVENSALALNATNLHFTLQACTGLRSFPLLLIPCHVAESPKKQSSCL